MCWCTLTFLAIAAISGTIGTVGLIRRRRIARQRVAAVQARLITPYSEIRAPA